MPQLADGEVDPNQRGEQIEGTSFRERVKGLYDAVFPTLGVKQEEAEALRELIVQQMIHYAKGGERNPFKLPT